MSTKKPFEVTEIDVSELEFDPGNLEKWANAWEPQDREIVRARTGRPDAWLHLLKVRP